jgi:hypothetical protein
MHANTKSLALALVLALALPPAALAAKPLVTEAEIIIAEQTGNLSALYNRLNADLATRERDSRKWAPWFAQLDAIGRKLATQLDTSLRQRMDASRLKSQIVPLNVLTDVEAAAAPMQTWEPARHDVFVKDVAREQGITRKAVADTQAYLDRLPGDAYRKGMNTLQTMEQLTGDTRWGEQRETVLRTARAEYEQAVATDAFERALQLLDELPADGNTEATRIELQTRMLETRMNEALARDQPDQGFILFRSIAQSPSFTALKPRIEPTAVNMANYFVALAGNATNTGDYPSAYRWFAQAREIRAALGHRIELLAEEKAFVDRVYRGHDAARKAGQWGVALGYLALAQEFDPARPTLAQDIRAVSEAVATAAVPNAVVQPFRGAPGDADYSSRVANKVSEYLGRNIPHDVNLLAPGTPATLQMQFTGSIDQARVESSEGRIQKTMRVVTEKNVMSPNPKYEEWKRLPERERRNYQAPAAQIPLDRTEDVSVEVTQVRKVGYFSTAFQVVDAASGKITHADSVTLKREFSDEGNEGIELGHFRLPARTAQVPTDIEVLDQLSSEAALDIGKRLAAKIGSLEQRYAAAGQAAAGTGNFIDATQNLAMALVVGQRKQLDVAAFNQDMKRYAAACGYAR